jgi:hypothetical protein
MVAARVVDYNTTQALLDAGANLYVGSDMFGRGALDLAAHFASGQGLTRREEETSWEQRRIQILSLLMEYAQRMEE